MTVTCSRLGSEVIPLGVPGVEFGRRRLEGTSYSRGEKPRKLEGHGHCPFWTSKWMHPADGVFRVIHNAGASSQLRVSLLSSASESRYTGTWWVPCGSQVRLLMMTFGTRSNGSGSMCVLKYFVKEALLVDVVVVVVVGLEPDRFAGCLGR